MACLWAIYWFLVCLNINSYQSCQPHVCREKRSGEWGGGRKRFSVRWEHNLGLYSPYQRIGRCEVDGVVGGIWRLCKVVPVFHSWKCDHHAPDASLCLSHLWSGKNNILSVGEAPTQPLPASSSPLCSKSMGFTCNTTIPFCPCKLGLNYFSPGSNFPLQKKSCMYSELPNHGSCLHHLTCIHTLSWTPWYLTAACALVLQVVPSGVLLLTQPLGSTFLVCTPVTTEPPLVFSNSGQPQGFLLLPGMWVESQPWACCSMPNLVFDARG